MKQKISFRANMPLRKLSIQLEMRKEMRYKLCMCLMVLFFTDLLLPSHAFCQKNDDGSSVTASKALILVQAVMCEGIKDYKPLNPGIVFSVNIETVSCFTSFDGVRQRTFIYQTWFHRDGLSTRRKLFLQPPRWSTFSSIQPRETDIGPWRVEITDEQGHILRVLRFSITD
jgi:hypothetical protein